MHSGDRDHPSTVVSRNMEGVGTSATLALLETIQRRRAEGRTVWDLGLGEPVFPAPPASVRAAIESVQRDDLRYGPVAGTPALRESIAARARTADANGMAIAAANVVVSNGSKQALFNACFVLFGEGDEVLVPTPAWTSYYDIVRLSRARPVPVRGDPRASFKVDVDRLAAAASPRTRGLILNNPCNPTGAVYSRQELTDILHLADERGWWIISDEIYREFSYDTPTTSLASLGGEFKRLVVTNGMSKAFAMPGWRIGWSIAPIAVTRLIVSLQSQTTAGAGNAGQAAAIAVLQDEQTDTYLASIREAFRRRRDCAMDILRDVDGLEIVMPLGAFYCFFKTPARGENGDDAGRFCQRLLDAHDVAVVPGDAFGTPLWARASYSAHDDSVREGFGRLAQFLREYPPSLGS
ncbi:MAG: aminotransferase class I/II-fold pyridoxal phosphate-dependent enzyme [bacterium]